MICYCSDFSKTYQNLQKIFERFRQTNLKLKVSREFLGNVVSEEGINCDPKKNEAVTE